MRCLSRRELIGHISPIGLICLIGATSAFPADPPAVPLRGEIRDADSGQLLPARLYIQSADGTKWFFAKSADVKGSAIVYDKARDQKSIEKHTTLSAHPFVAELPPGKYTLTVERGKEYLTATKEIEVGTQPIGVKIELKRWINMAERGWYSGDTHVHRPISELSNVALAEDLNMVYPMSQWVTVTHTLPEKGRVDPQPIPTEPIFADPTHAIVPLNTEYEIFSVGPKRHTLGAVLILGQKESLKVGIPPLKTVAEEAHKQGALLDLEKHSWAWTPIIAPVMKADLYPLSNNHIWRTEFAFKSWTIENNWRDNPRIETDKDGFTELGWLHFGWEQYYAMLNCGLRMRPTAGTANGVHPVPAGFSRVYVDLGKETFTPELWQKRLNEGHSFVTTGPMLLTSVTDDGKGHCRVIATVDSIYPNGSLEIIVDGLVDVAVEVEPGRPMAGGLSHANLKLEVELQSSSWIAARVFEPLPNGRIRFAHSAPVFVEVPGKPMRPRRDQVRYLIQRCEEEIARNKDVLSDAELAEYREALEFYRGKLETAR
ncbi:MAG: hypothetical protein IAG10_18455 [Planctomycetaceae bacterium]|nr:hypothetical protein [Planctomycetaceae bacterium]